MKTFILSILLSFCLFANSQLVSDKSCILMKDSIALDSLLLKLSFEKAGNSLTLYYNYSSISYFLMLKNDKISLNIDSGKKIMSFNFNQNLSKSHLFIIDSNLMIDSLSLAKLSLMNSNCFKTFISPNTCVDIKDKNIFLNSDLPSGIGVLTRYNSSNMPTRLIVVSPVFLIDSNYFNFFEIQISVKKNLINHYVYKINIKVFEYDNKINARKYDYVFKRRFFWNKSKYKLKPMVSCS